MERRTITSPLFHPFPKPRLKTPAKPGRCTFYTLLYLRPEESDIAGGPSKQDKRKGARRPRQSGPTCAAKASDPAARSSTSPWRLAALADLGWLGEQLLLTCTAGESCSHSRREPRRGSLAGFGRREPGRGKMCRRSEPRSPFFH